MFKYRRLILVALVALLGSVAAPAPASAATPADGAWFCYVPNGWTYDTARIAYGATPCQPGSYEYHLRRPADGVWSCSNIVRGFAYNQIEHGNFTCHPNFFVNRYLLRTPYTGLWSCNVPDDFTYTAIRPVGAGVCAASTPYYQFLLQRLP